MARPLFTEEENKYMFQLLGLPSCYEFVMAGTESGPDEVKLTQ